MNKRILNIMLLVVLSILLVAQTSFARPKYLESVNEVFGNGSCETCHVKTISDAPRNSYGTLFENQPGHVTDAMTALKAIGSPIAVNTTSASTTLAATPAAAGMGFASSLIGLSVLAFMAKRLNFIRKK